MEVPTSVAHAHFLDNQNEGTKWATAWADAIKKEISSLIALGCFNFKPPNYKPGNDYQFEPTHIVFDVKLCGKQKARLMADGNRVDPQDISTRSAVVRGISVCLLDVIQHRDNLGMLCGDVDNAFITADCFKSIIQTPFYRVSF